MIKKWKPREYVNFHGYKVHIDGSILSKKEDKILSPWKVRSRSGTTYLKVGLYINGKRRRMFVHRVVMYAHVGRRDRLQVDHDNTNTHDNNLGNLSYVTPKENNQRKLN